jgi:hypothetical protein
MNDTNLQHPYQKMPLLGDSCIRVIAKFYNPKHTGSNDRIIRLQKQAEIVMKMATCIKHQLRIYATHQSIKSEFLVEKISKHLNCLVDGWGQLRRTTEPEERIFSSEEEEDEKEDDLTEVRIARVFLKKRYLLNIITFIFNNEERIANLNSKDMTKLVDLVQEDTMDWMELLDYLQTMKNPNYLDK